ncbi:MAG: bacillithiol biosynthesis cysteine-adding enzyme BshC [Acidobacteria bacterium]|nr:bacillithiol biosynthesis cysteine-adding enzyme BshC [Acidobacteriota bacterium]
MTVNDSSSSAASRADSKADIPDQRGRDQRDSDRPAGSPRDVDLVAAGLVPALPAAFASGKALELLEPIEFLGSAADSLDRPLPGADRRQLAEALGVANAAYGHRRAEALAALLADPATAVVVTGQQTGLFGGPLYALTKAVAAALWAERLTAAGRPAVAVFWMATEDHDYREVARATFPVVSSATGSKLLALELGDDPTPLMPVGMRALGPNVDQVLETLRGAFPGERFSEWVDRLASWYRPNARFGEAFARLMVGLLGDRCPLLLDAMLPAVKEAERPWLERIVVEHEQITAAQSAREDAIQAAGYELQVQPQLGASPLFYLHGMERRRLALEGDQVSLRGRDAFSETRSWLEEAVRENPAVVSPGVLARPAIQDAILGTHLQILGPGEVSYMPQVAPLYDYLEIPPPLVAIRPHALVLGRHQLDKLDASGLELADLVAPNLDLDRVLGGEEGDELVAGAAADIGKRLDQLGARALEVDATLAGPFEKTKSRIEGALSGFAARAAMAVAQRDQVTRQRAEALREVCRPQGALQERVVSSAYFPGKYGDRFVEALFEQLDLDWRRLSVIDPS